MTTFADRWDTSVVGPVGNGTFDPVGNNYSTTGYGPVPQTSPNPDRFATFYDTPNLNNLDITKVTGNSALADPGNEMPGSAHAPSPNAQFGMPDALNPFAGAGAGVAADLLGGGKGGATFSLSDFFNRAVLIILGFIFVGVGLAMFGGRAVLAPSIPRV